MKVKIKSERNLDKYTFSPENLKELSLLEDFNKALKYRADELEKFLQEINKV